MKFYNISRPRRGKFPVLHNVMFNTKTQGGIETWLPPSWGNSAEGSLGVIRDLSSSQGSAGMTAAQYFVLGFDEFP